MLFVQFDRNQAVGLGCGALDVFHLGVHTVQIAAGLKLRFGYVIQRGELDLAVAGMKHDCLAPASWKVHDEQRSDTSGVAGGE